MTQGQNPDINNQKTDWRVVGAGLLLCIVFILVSWHFINYLRIPVSMIHIEEAGIDTVAVPPRPGSQAVVLTSAPVEKLRFEIDLSKTSRLIDWNELRAIYPPVDVSVTIDVLDNGRVKLLYVKGNYSKSERLIADAMRTWRFKNFKKGKIHYWFNLPSNDPSALLNIDASNLTKHSGDLRPIAPENGRLYGIANLDRNAVRNGATLSF